MKKRLLKLVSVVMITAVAFTLPITESSAIDEYGECCIACGTCHDYCEAEFYQCLSINGCWVDSQGPYCEAIIIYCNSGYEYCSNDCTNSGVCRRCN